jgi:glycosyltransferase involved in cell wall biosynthesis
MSVTRQLSVGGLEAHLETPIPPILAVGKGTACCLTGWCYHPMHQIRELRITANGVSYPVKGHRVWRPDVLRARSGSEDPKGYSASSGFWGIVPFPSDYANSVVELGVEARLSTGDAVTARIASLETRSSTEHPSWLLPSLKPPREGGGPTVAICLATHKPDIELFTRQIESLISQTYRNWICIISDDSSPPETYFWLRAIVERDSRFFTTRSTEPLGFYRNFERCLSLVPEWCEFIALSDQDDRWHPEKLETLLAQAAEGATLVFSDMNIVGRDGTVIAPTYWTERRNNYTDLAGLLLANTVTGAASLFRRTLIDYALPFPMRIGDAFHDHWIAAVALTLGRLAYVNRPLYDYVQHDANVLGHHVPKRDERRNHLVRFVRALAREPAERAIGLARWEGIYFNDLLRLELMARILELRCGNEAGADHRRLLRRLTSLDESVSGAAWLATRSMRRNRYERTTLGAESALLGGVLWRHLAAERATRARPDPHLAVTGTQTASANGHHPALERAYALREKVAPLSLRVNVEAPARVNVLIPTIDARYVFGGYLTKFNLARRLAERGRRVRLVAVDHTVDDPDTWRRELARYDGLGRLFDLCEVVCAFDRSKALEVSARDCFLATTWWTAHIAHRAAVDLGSRRFVYLIQEYEPFTFSMGSFAALAAESYALPHLAVFSTEMLRAYFRDNKIGVFAEGNDEGDRNSLSFENAITDVGRIRRRELARRGVKRLLFYARPEDHAARNMFELGYLALSEALSAGYFRGAWHFSGIGTLSDRQFLTLDQDTVMELLQRQTQDTYAQVLRSHDIGMALMHTPHPSLVPIEMASAGMAVVTTTYATKTRRALAEISPNIIGVEPTLDGVKSGLREAIERAQDCAARARGSHVRWSRRWERSFDDPTVSRIEKLLAAAERREA